MAERNEILRQLPKYILLNVMGMIGISCYILADTFFVSAGLGADGLAALNLALPVYSFVHGSGLMAAVAEEGMKIYFIMLPFAGFNIVTAMFFSAIEKPLPAQVISLSRGLIIVIPAALLMTKAAGLLGLWLALPVTEGVTSLMCLWLCLRRRNAGPEPEAG